jgi:hypothetical protein
MPVLRNFAPPVEIPVDESGTASRSEVVPWSVPGSKLRTKTGAARRGRYAPALPGAPTTTRQAEILNTAIIGPPTGTKGIVNGRDVLSRTRISYDPATAYNATPRQVSSPNVIIVGDVGAGKSSHTKCNYVLRPLILKNRRGVVFDKKDQLGEGEYSNVVRHFGGQHIKFSAEGSDATLNLLDPMIARGSGVKGMVQLLTTVTRIAREDEPLNEWETEALRAALRLTVTAHEDGRTPVLADVLPNLGKIVNDAEYLDLSPQAKDDLHRAGLGVRFTLNGLLDEYAGLLDGETSKDVDLSAKLTSFDISQLPDEGPAVPVVMAIGNMWMLGRLKQERNSVTAVVYEEGWHMIGGPSAQLLKSNQKLSRALGIENVFVMHKGSDIPENSPGMAIIQEAQTIVVYRQSRPDDALWAQRTFGFAPETARTIETLRDGHYIFKYGSQPETHVQHIRSGWEKKITDTDEGLAAAAAGE